MPTVTLLSDFGPADTYVGQMKGAILAVCPAAALVDLTHDIPAQDVRRGAFSLWAAVLPFSPATIHLAVVDPGVGSARKGIAVRSSRGDVFIGPDNGILVPAVERLGGIGFAVELTNPQFWRQEISRTFHGRDIFAPVAGHLARGAALDAIGRPIADLSSPFRFPIPIRAPEGRAIAGEVVHVDRFGNLVSSIPEELLPPKFQVKLDTHRIAGARDAIYESAPPGGLIALVGSSGLLEIAARNASASAALGVSIGRPLSVEATPS